nr:FGGY family carbohydrate kinase [Geomicrobium sp. JCM 19039]
MEYVVGIDLGTSAVKTMLLGRDGAVAAERSQRLALIQDQVGHSEQDPEAWVNAVITCLRQLPVQAHEVKGISLSGQMHGLVLLNKEGKPLRHAILWNDTRTTAQCEYIHDVVGRQELQQITNNWALEGFTLPKLLWVKEHEPEIYEQAEVFLLPKDYVRYRLTGVIGTDYSDAAGTLLLDTIKKAWSNELMQALHIKSSMCPPIFESTEEAGRILSSIGCMENVPFLLVAQITRAVLSVQVYWSMGIHSQASEPQVLFFHRVVRHKRGCTFSIMQAPMITI